MINVKRFLTTLMCGVFVSHAVGLSAFTASAATGDFRTFVYDDYEITYNVTNSWGNTEAVTVSIINTGDETIENWMLYFDPNGEISPNNIWDAQTALTTSGITYFTNAGYNSAILPNASVNFSYFVDNCEAIPDEFIMCQKRAEHAEYSVRVVIDGAWGNNFNGTIILENTSDNPIKDWELTFDTNFTITEITGSWAGTMTALEPYSYMLKGSYTNVIAPHTSVNLGFSGVKNGTPDIISSTLTEVVVDESIFPSIDEYQYQPNCVNWEDMSDSDGDGLPDEYENRIGTNPLLTDSDSDGLPDGYEVLTLGSDPLNTNSYSNIVSDADYDNDSDELSNYQEYQLRTDPMRPDSDFDGLTDGQETNTHHTNPLDEDTDDDGISDGDEIALGLNPLLADSDNDGILDNEVKISQSITFDGAESDELIDKISVSFNGTGYIYSTTHVESVKDIDWMCSNVVGLIGEPYDITTSSKFTDAVITLKVDEVSLGDTNFNDLIVLWYNEDDQRFVDMNAEKDATTHTLEFSTEHFSKYMIVNCNEWYDAWSENYYPTNGNVLHTAITLDCSSSMETSDPNRYRVTAADSFVDVMKAADLASVIFFADGASIKQGLTDDQEALHAAIDQTFPGGTTNYEAAFQRSLEALSVHHDNTAEDIIIFLSDGAPTRTIDGAGYAIPADEFDYTIIDTVASAGIKVYTIGLGIRVDTEEPTDAEIILREIATRTNGQYFYADTADKLIEHFLTINAAKKYDIVTDSDEDGIPDLFETYGIPTANGGVIFTNPNNRDSDNDGLTDGEEIIMHIVDDDDDEVCNAYKFMYDYIPDALICDTGGIYFELATDPSSADTDSDGISDYDEVKIYTTNPNKEDTDGDGIPDGVESHNLDKLRPTIKDTIYSLYPELHNEDNDINQENNAVYIEVAKDSNDITFNIRIVFDEYADNVAVDYLNTNIASGYIDDIVSRIEKNLNQITFKDLILDGISYRWTEGFNNNRIFRGSDFDFYPGLNPNVKFNLLVVPKDGDDNFNPVVQHAVTFYTDPNVVAVSNAGWESRYFVVDGEEYGISNPRVVLTRTYSSLNGPFENFITYEGTAAHEFGHILGLPDAYPGSDVDQYCNYGFSCASDNPQDEIYINDDSNLSYPNAGEIMWTNGMAVSNDIEMLLWKYETGNDQRFTSTYDQSLSPAIRQVKGYQYKNHYENVENQPYSLNQRYVFIDSKGYIPLNSEIKEYVSNEGYELLYYEEELGGIVGLSIYGLSDSSSSYSGNVTIPSVIDGIRVRKISDGAFINSSISSITFPDSIITIGQRAFYNCVNLSSIDIPANVEIIRPYTFSGCTSLSAVNNPKDLKYIGIYAFEYSALSSYTIPKNVKLIYTNSFNKCYDIQKYIVEEGNENYYSMDGVLFYKNNENKQTGIQIELLKYPVAKNTSSYSVPNSVDIIGDSAFFNADYLSSIIFNNDLIEVKHSAFENCDILNNLEIPYTVTTIGAYAFYGCNSLTNVTFKASTPQGYADNIFWGSDSNLRINIPYGSISNYDGWPKGGNITYCEIVEES